MSYSSIADVADSGSLRRRVTACAAQEGEQDPDTFAWAHRWEYAAQPGWGDAFASAAAGGNTDPGADPAVITDAQILSATQEIRAGS